MSILINDIKSGTTVRFKDGHEAVVMDSKKGLIRDVKAPIIGMPGQTEIGSCYAYEWAYALVGKEWKKVIMTDAQKKQAAKISGIMDIL